MFSLLIIAASGLAQTASVLSQMEAGPQAVLEAQIVLRPAGTPSQALITALAQEAGAGSWQRVEQEVEASPFRFVMTGFRDPAGGSPLAFYSLRGEDPAQAGRVCRVRVRERPGRGEGDEVARVSRFCLSGIAPAPAQR
jgi:hypothetical protein